MSSYPISLQINMVFVSCIDMQLNKYTKTWIGQNQFKPTDLDAFENLSEVFISCTILDFKHKMVQALGLGHSRLQKGGLGISSSLPNKPTFLGTRYECEKKKILFCASSTGFCEANITSPMQVCNALKTPVSGVLAPLYS